jgi:O-antigen ligase
VGPDLVVADDLPDPMSDGLLGQRRRSLLHNVVLYLRKEGLGAYFLVYPFLAVVVPKSLTVFVAITGLLALATPQVPRCALRLVRTLPGFAAVALYAWYVVTSAWSPDPQSQVWAEHSALRPGLLVLLGIVLLGAVESLDEPERRRLSTWLAWCALAFALLFAVGTFGCGAVSWRDMPMLWNGERVCQEPAVWHAAPIVAMLAMPLGVAIWRRFGWRVLLPVAVLAVLAIALNYRSIARAASVLGLLAFVLVLLGGRRVGIAIAAILAAWVLAAPFAMGWLLHNPVVAERVKELPISWQERTIIWSTTIGHIEQAPLLGHGAGFSRYFKAAKRPPIVLYGADGIISAPSEFRDPHSVILHAWVEAGAIGAVLLALGLLSMVVAAARLPATRTAFAAAIAALVGWFTFASTDWSMSDSLSVATAWSVLVVAAALLRSQRSSALSAEVGRL